MHTLTVQECGPLHPWTFLWCKNEARSLREQMGKSWRYSIWCCFWQLVARLSENSLCPAFLENAFMQQGIFLIRVMFISRDPPIRENLFCPQIKYVSNSIMSAQHSLMILLLLIKDIDPDQMPSPRQYPQLPTPHPHQPVTYWKMSIFVKKLYYVMKLITIEYKWVLTFFF